MVDRFGLILHFPYANGQSPMRAGLANLPLIVTMIAALVTTSLPAGTWSNDLVASLFHGEQVIYVVLALVVGLVAGGGALTLTDSRSTEEPV